MNSPRTIALLGGPSTGKSTFLGALVDALQTHRLKYLRLERLDDDARGLQRLADPLLEGHYPQRTTAGPHLELVASLRTAGDFFEPCSFALRAGDYDGEEVDRLFRDRIHGWSEEWRNRAHADALILLLRADALTRLPQIAPPAEIEEATRWRLLRGEPIPIKGELGLERAPTAPLHPEHVFGAMSLDEVPPPTRAMPTDPVRVPTAISIIELLQFIRHVRQLAPGERPQGDRQLRIALLVSAWDSVAPEWRQAGPAAYLAHHLPLLEDFLWSNFLPEDVFRFGLSSTGGDLRNPDYSEKYLDNPCGFVEWVDMRGRQQRSDIGLPLYWLLFGEHALSAP
nr:hypothetical protein [Corallococcus exercitus]